MKKEMAACFFSLICSCVLAQPEPRNNAGIGIVNPTLARLQVNGVSGAGTTSAIFGGDGTGISMQRSLPVIGFNQYRDNTTGNGRYMANGFAATQTFDHNTGFMYFDMFPYGVAGQLTTAPNRGVSIGNTGNWGIKTDPLPDVSLYVIKADNQMGAAFNGSTFPSFFCIGGTESTYIRGGKDASRVLINDNNPGNIILGSGNTLVGINTSLPLATLDIWQAGGKGMILVDADHNFDNWEFHVGLYQDAPQSDLKVYSNGNFVSFFSAVYGYYSPISSDRRIKTNIQPLASVLGKLKMLQPKEYEMKSFNVQEEKTVGFIAQDVRKLYPSFVHIEKHHTDSVNHIADLHSLSFEGFDAIAVRALQEQYKQLRTLEEKNSLLVRKIEQLEKRVNEKLKPQ